MKLISKFSLFLLSSALFAEPVVVNYEMDVGQNISYLVKSQIKIKKVDRKKADDSFQIVYSSDAELTYSVEDITEEGNYLIMAHVENENGAIKGALGHLQIDLHFDEDVNEESLDGSFELTKEGRALNDESSYWRFPHFPKEGVEAAGSFKDRTNRALCRVNPKFTPESAHFYLRGKVDPRSDLKDMKGLGVKIKKDKFISNGWTQSKISLADGWPEKCKYRSEFAFKGEVEGIKGSYRALVTHSYKRIDN